MDNLSIKSATSAEQLTTIPRGFIRRKRLVEKYGDFQAVVARQLGVTASAVNQAWQKQASESRIGVALLAELNRRIEERSQAETAA